MAILTVEFHTKRLGTPDRLAGGSLRDRRKADRHPHHELMLLDRGAMRALVGQDRYSVPQGGIWWYAAGVAHRTLMPQVSGSRHWFIAWTQEPPPPSDHGSLADPTGRLAMILSWLHDRWQQGKQDLCENILRVLLAEVTERIHAVEPVDAMDRLRRHIETRWDQTLTVEDLMAVSGLSRRSLHRHFVERFHVGPLTWHRRCRAEHARALLRDTTLSSDEVAERMGLQDTAALARLLRRQFGTSTAIRRGGRGGG